MEVRKPIGGKLRDQSGVTLVLALVVFLIAILLSMTLITGALSSVQNAARQRKEEQAYLSSVSAASLLKHYICDNGAFVRHVEITKDENVYNNLSSDLKAYVDSQLPDICRGYDLKDSNDITYLSGWLAFPKGTALKPDGTLQMPPKLCQESEAVHLIPGNVEELITYSLCYLLSDGQGETHTIVIKIPDIEQEIPETTVNFNMEDGTKRWKLTAELSTEIDSLMSYLSDLIFTCSVTQRTNSYAVPYTEDVTDPDGSIHPQTRYCPVTVNITEYRWTLDTAGRGEHT